MSELRPGGRELIEAARRERTPSSEARSRVLAGVLASAGAVAAAGPAKAATAAATANVAKAGFLKATLIAALAIGGVTASYFWWRAPHSLPARREVVSAAAPSMARPAAPEPPVAIPANDATPAASVTISAPSVEKHAPTPEAPASASGFDRELSVLQRAHAAYRSGQPALALELAREHASSFPRSQLGAEDRTIQVLALCALGRTKQAQAIADKLRAASGSPALNGLEGSCVSH